jgi:hypothetical protein
MEKEKLIGKRVMNTATHMIGTIQYIQDGHIAIDFHGSVSRFAYPAAFAELLELEDENLQEEIETEGVSASFEDFKRDYVRALNNEVTYLKMTGGRKYTIIDGEKILFQNDEYWYAFDMDTDMDFPDGTPIKLWFPENIVPAYVISCEDFTLMIRTHENMGG